MTHGDDALTAFLRAAASREFRLGTHDCGLWLADWYMAATGKPDPAVHLRGGGYGADELMRHMHPIIGALQLPEADTPQRGDIGIIKFNGRDVGGVFSGTRWMVIGERGLRSLPPVPPGLIRAWKVQ